MRCAVEARRSVGWLTLSRWFVVCTFCLGNAWAGPDDQFLLGQLAYQRGDFSTAMGILRAPAKTGHAASQTLLAYILDHADFPDEAARLYEAAAAQGNAEALAGLGNLYLTGRGIAKDENQALAHFSKAAELGHAPSIQVLADAHLKGSMGLGREPRDNDRALTALRRAAERGHLPAAEALAKAYREGGYGLVADAAQATQWQTRIAEMRQQRTGAVPKAKP